MTTVLEAFEVNGIDYLLKPIRTDRIAAPLDKYDRIRGHFGGDYTSLARLSSTRKSRERFLVRKGSDLISVPVNRAFLVAIDSIARCSSYTKGRLLLALRPPIERKVIVSQERAAAFRQWLDE